MRIVIGIIMGIVTVLLGVYTSFAARQKGPILSNTYLWLSKEERKMADKKAEYHLVTVIFGGLTMVFLMETIYIFTLLKITHTIGFCFIGFIVIYAIFDTVKSRK